MGEVKEKVGKLVRDTFLTSKALKIFLRPGFRRN